MSMDAKENSFPLSLSQQNILSLERAYSGTPINNISTTVRISGRVELSVLQQSINCVLESDSSLRTRICLHNDVPVQYHAPYVHEDFPVLDFTNTSREGIENWEISVTRELIPLYDGPLYRFVLFKDAENSGGVLVKLHHIIADGWSQIMLCNKIGRTYLELLSGKQPDLEKAPDYKLHVEEEQAYLSSKAYKRDECYWKQTVEKSGEPSVLKSVNSAAVSPVGRRMSFELPQVLNHAIYSFCREKRVAPFAVFYMALAIYFKRIGGAERFTIGVPIFNRTNYEFKQSTGMFVTTLPFYNEINDEWSLNKFNDELMENWYEMLRHQRYPFSKISELSGENGRLFNIAFSYQDSKIFESRDASVMLSGRWHYCGYQAEQMTIHLTNLINHQQYAVDYDYLAQFFTEDDIVSLHRNLCHILNEALTDTDRPIYRLNVLSIEEKEQLLYSFNKTDRYLEERSVYSALVKNNSRYLNRAAIIHNGERMTYGALLHRGAMFSMALAGYADKKDCLVAIILPRDFDLPAAMIGVLQSGCAYMLLSEHLPDERIKGILSQSEANIIITDERGRIRFSDLDIPLICADDLDDLCGASANIIPCSDDENIGDKLAYVVYTSGSTGAPKGVEITQRNLLNLAQEMKPVYGQGAVLSVCNVGFDAFMLESIVALLNGRTIVFPDESELDSPDRLATLINGYAVGFFSMTPSRLSVLLQNSSFRKVMWRMESIVCGGEHFPAELLKKLKLCTHARIYNQYGPSETAVAVSMKELSRADRITAGMPMGNCRLYVLDQWMNPLPIGGSGRLYIGGKCVGRGYRNRPDLTAQSFRPNPFVTDDNIYDTGDLAYWTSDGEIVLNGRADSQVKLRGLRIELQEISSCVESYPSVTAAYTRVCDINGQSVLSVYYCSAADINESALLSYMATYLPGYMIPSFIIRVSALPINSNGKVDEKALPLPENSVEDVCDNMSHTAERILNVFRAVLKNDGIQGNSDYFLFGGNSLNAMECIIQIEEKLGSKIRVADLYACRTAVKLAALLDGNTVSLCASADKKTACGLVKAPQQNEYPLTPIQQGIYVQSVLDPNGFAYHMPGAFLLEQEPDTARLEAAFKTLIQEDPVFRTVFVQKNGAVFARILDNVPFSLERLSADNYRDACNEFLRPFDLTSAPLLRGALWQDADGKWYLFINSHHIIGDGLSTPILLERLDRAYCGNEITVDWNFYDYIHTLHTQEKTAERKDLKYWVDHLQNIPDQLLLPTDFRRGKRFDYKGGEFETLLNADESLASEQFCKTHGCSEYALYLAAYGILLSAVSGRNDFVIGTPVAGRELSGTSGICGPFINTLPLRLKPESDITAETWVKRVQTEVNAMLDNRRVSLEDIIDALQLERGEQNSLYRVMFTQSPVDEDALMFDGAQMTYHPVSTGAVKMDLIVELTKKHGLHTFRFSYASSLFTEETIAFYGRCLKQIVHELINNSSKTVDSITIMCPQDTDAYVDTPNYSVTPFVNRPIHKLLQSKSAVMSGETAIIFHDEKITYSQLERRACAIAEFIEKNGVSAGQCVGLCLSRNPDMIAAMYGVLKAGCSYMFMLDSFPEARLRYMIEISDAALVLCDERSFEKLGVSFGGTLRCDVCMLPEGEADTYNDRSVDDSGLVNVLFTSGSTGKPKGVMLCHRSISNLYSQMKSLLDPIEGTVLCSTNSVFDCFVVETIIALALGRTVVLADEEEMMLPWKLAELMEKYNTGIFEMTPSRLQMCLGNDSFCEAAHNIRIVLLGGEVVTPKLAEKFYQHSNGILMNMYGPTEATVFTTMGKVVNGEHITIGKPLQNTRAYVLDDNLKPVIPTACGEMFIAGECLAAGYINRPELTESSFCDDIYFRGAKMYRSGDIVRLRTDGTYDYIGRKDTQVKLNGQRVELTEISGAIESAEGVEKAVTVAVRKDDGSMELCAFFTDPSEKTTEADVSAHISGILPPYMLPSRIIRLSSMPMTATNKVDMVTLHEMACDGIKHLETDRNDYKNITVECEKTQEKPCVTAENVNAEYVLSVWNRVLTTPSDDADVSFFKIGGTSMAALTVLSHYYNDNLEMSLSEFYENPTASAQAAVLRGKGCSIKTAETLSDETVPSSADAALVTGATGFFGAHLVNELLYSSVNKIICLMRDGNAERLKKCFIQYFGESITDVFDSKIEVVKGDISVETLGMSEEEYACLCSRIVEIYHCAADVRHYASNKEAYLAVNVDGTANMLALAKRSGASFYHMSTCSVSGEVLKDGRQNVEFTEKDYDIGQIWDQNIYVKSKYLAEGLVFDAIRDGVSAKIFRLGRLVGRASDGKFQLNPDNNVFYLFIKGFCQLGAIPAAAADLKMDLMPIDICAKEVLALKNSKETVFHIMNPDPPAFKEIMSCVNKNVLVLDEREFRDHFKSRSSNVEGSLIALIMNTCRSFGGSQAGIKVINTYTVKALEDAGFVPPEFKIGTVLKDFAKGE